MKTTEQANVEAARRLPAERRAEALIAWDRVHGALQDQLDALPAKRKPKVFEVRHVVTKGRAAFLAALVEGCATEGCEAAALAVFKAAYP